MPDHCLAFLLILIGATIARYPLQNVIKICFPFFPIEAVSVTLYKAIILRHSPQYQRIIFDVLITVDFYPLRFIRRNSDVLAYRLIAV